MSAELLPAGVQVAVVGSGPGGAMTAAVLAEAGHEVLLLEEGPPVDRALPPFSPAEIAERMRYGGLNAALGRVRVTYLEGRCVGGGSEVNAALYHRPPERVLARWAARTGLDMLSPASLGPHLDAVEVEGGVTRWPGGPGKASEALAAGAEALGWAHVELPRFWDHGAGRRRGMSRTLIPRALQAGARLVAGARVQRLEWDRGRVAGLLVHHGGRQHRLRCGVVFVCAGAVQTAALLRRSGIRGLGRTLTLNPMIRLVARFRDPINEPWRGVPVQQVEAFKPATTLGLSHASPGHLALWLPPAVRSEAIREWKRHQILYVKVSGRGRGRVHALPRGGELVHHPVTREDRQALREGLARLVRLAFAMGADRVYDPAGSSEPLGDPGQAEQAARRLDVRRASVSAIHLHSSVPLGLPGRGLVGSGGRMHGWANLYVNDASLFPDSPGVNPQGTVLAIARANALRAVEQGLGGLRA